MKSIMIIGNGGHAKVIKDIISRNDSLTFKGYLDDNIKKFYERDGLIYDCLDNISKYYTDYYFIIAIGNNEIREVIYNRLNIPNERFQKLIDPSAIIGTNVKVGNGTVVMPNSVINADSVIGEHCIINTASIVEHDNYIEDFVHISPNSTLTGGVKVGSGSQIGASATVIPQKSIGKKYNSWCWGYSR